VRPKESKEDRARPMASMSQAGHIKIIRGPWNSILLDELAAFPMEGVFRDQVDSLTQAFKFLTKHGSERSFLNA